MSKTNGLRAALRGKRIALAVAAAFLPWDDTQAQVAPNTLPTNGNFAAGTGTIHTPTPENYLRVDQASTKGIINWDSFSIGSAAHVHFNHDAGRAGMTLNRVVGNEASQIFGRLSSTGQIFLVNNAGVLFAPGAAVDVGALLASTLSITDQNFLNGNYQFYNPGNAGSVTNAGSIITSGGYTALVGPQVRNDGVIIANAGKVALAAGNAVSLTIGDSLISVVVDEPAYNASVINTGTLQADGGTVLLKASSMNGLLDTVINTSGVVRASSLVERNGEIVLEGGTGMVVASGTVDAANVSISGGSIWGSGILADTLTTRSDSSTILSGENHVASYNGTSVDRLFFFNRGDLNVTSVQAASADVSVDGALTISGAWMTGGPTMISASGVLSETAGGFIEASGTSSLSAQGGVNLNGPNRISGTLFGGSNQGDFALSNLGDLNFSAFAGSAAFPGPGGVPGNPRDINLVNTGTLNVMSLSGRNLTVTNTGRMSISGLWTSGEATSISTAGPGSDLTVTSSIFSNGPMTVNVDGALTLAAGLQAAPPPPTPDFPPFPPTPQFLSITSSAGQEIVARAIYISATDGASASITNQIAGNQTITATGGGLRVRSSGGAATPGQPMSSAQIGNSAGIQTINVVGGPGIDIESQGGRAFLSQNTGAAQNILVVDADHIKVNGTSGLAGISAGGAQTISITGSGANALTLGGTGNLGSSQISGGTQAITAGTGTQAGSITIAGADIPSSFIGIVSSQIAAGTQTVSTSGTLRLSAGAATNTPPSGSSVGVSHNGSGEQKVKAANLEVNGGTGGVNNVALILSTGGAGAIAAGNQVIDVSGQIALQGGPAGSSNSAIISSSAKQTVKAGSIALQGGAAGSGNNAFINTSAGADQALNVSGAIWVTGGDGGAANRAGMTSAGAQTITGNPEIVLKGGAGGNGNNVFIQATSGDVAKPQTINARSIELRAGAGIDASATLNAARNVITTTGDVSIYGSAGGGGSNGARIGGIGGTVLGPTNLTLSVGGDLLVHGGTVNGASIGSSGPSTQSNTITVSAANVTLESEGAGARIGASNQTPVPTGNIAVTATGDLDVGAGTAIRANGPITLTANSLTNDGVITNGGGTNTGNVALIANAFDLNGGSIQGGNAAVVLRPRDGARSFGIEAAGATTLTNADLASISTTNFVVLGSGTGLNFTGDMAIGQNARVDGGTKGLAFFRSVDPAARTGTITIGAQGVTTAGGADVIIGAGKGNIVSAGGTITGDEVQLRASTGIGADGASVNTAANALAINSTSGAAFVSEADDVTLRNISLLVGGNGNNFGNVVGGSLELGAGGTLGVTDVVSSFGGQTITAQAVNVNAQGGRTAQLLNTAGDQTITAATIDVQTGAGGGLAEIRNNSAGQQTLTVTGDHLNVHGLGGGAANVFSGGNQLIETTSLAPRRITLGSEAALGASTINAGGDQTITGRADLFITGGAGPVQDGHNAFIVAFNPTRTQRIEAGNITMANSTLGGLNSVAAINGANQIIDATGNVTLTANASGGGLPGVRIGGLSGGAPTGTNLTLTLDGDLVLTGGTLSGNGVGIGSTASPTAPPLANFITIDAGGSVILNTRAEGAGARIGSPQTVTGPGEIRISAGGEIRLNGVDEFASIRTLGAVNLDAATITEAAKGRVIAGTLNIHTQGDALLTGPNEVAFFTAATDMGNVRFTNVAPVLTLGTMDLPGALSIDQAGDLLIGSAAASAPTMVYAAGDISIAAGGSVIVRGSDTTAGAASALLADGDLSVSANHFSLIGGAAPAAARGQAVSMMLDGNLAVTGGSGDFSPAVLSSGSNIDLTVGGQVRVDAGSGYLSLARIQTEIREGVIHITFPNLTSGGYFVNGVEGDNHQGQTGFFTLNKPAKLGSTLLIDYGS